MINGVRINAQVVQTQVFDAQRQAWAAYELRTSAVHKARFRAETNVENLTCLERQ
jgi:hypothetical protein